MTTSAPGEHFYDCAWKGTWDKKKKGNFLKLKVMAIECYFVLKPKDV